MVAFIKNYLLGMWLMLINLPRLLLGLILVILPIFVIGKALYFVFPDSYPLVSIISLVSGIFIILGTPYGLLVEKVSPFNSFRGESE